MSTAPQDQPSGTPFEAARQIYEAVKGLKAAQQEQALRWAAESLGLVIPITAKPAAPQPPGALQDRSTVTPAPPAPPLGEAVDIASFVESKQPRSDVQFVAVAAYYFKFKAPADQRRATIDAALLQDAITDTHWNGVPSAKTTLNNAKAQGYLKKGAARGEFAMTAVGENLVARGLPLGQGAEASPAKKPSKAGRRTKPRKQPRAKRAATARKRG